MIEQRQNKPATFCTHMVDHASIYILALATNNLATTAITKGKLSLLGIVMSLCHDVSRIFG